jgi:hypothetical protein
MKKTPFPTKPGDVVALTIPEFTFAVNAADPSLDDVCGRFPDDPNRALVWLVRFHALKAVTSQVEIAAWLAGETGSLRDAYYVAARLKLNERWEFDHVLFRSAVKALAAKRS